MTAEKERKHLSYEARNSDIISEKKKILQKLVSETFQIFLFRVFNRDVIFEERIFRSPVRLFPTHLCKTHHVCLHSAER